MTPSITRDETPPYRHFGDGHSSFRVLLIGDWRGAVRPLQSQRRRHVLPLRSRGNLSNGSRLERAATEDFRELFLWPYPMGLKMGE